MSKEQTKPNDAPKRCWTCNEMKPRDQFESIWGKICHECRAAGRSQWTKSKQSALRYRRDRIKILEQNKQWKEANGLRFRSQQREYRLARRERIFHEVLRHYGGACACCGVSERFFLTLDHIDGNGGAHRRQVGKMDMWLWAYRTGYPPIFRVLCFNCNAGRYRNGGRCPHEQPETVAEDASISS